MNKFWAIIMRTGIFTLIFGAFSFAVISLLNVYCTPEYLAPKVIGIESATADSISDNKLYISLQIAAHNDNQFPITVQNADLNLFYEGRNIGKAVIPGSVELLARDTTLVPVNITTLIDSLIDNKKTLSDTVEIAMQGTIAVDMGFTDIPVPVDMKYTFSIKEQLGKAVEKSGDKNDWVKVKSASLEDAGLRSTTVNIILTITNPYPVAFTLVSYPADIYVNDKHQGKGDLTNPITIPASGTAEGQVTCELQNTSVLGTALGAVFNGGLKYKTVGDVTFDVFEKRVTFPLELKGDLLRL